MNSMRCALSVAVVSSLLFASACKKDEARAGTPPLAPETPTAALLNRGGQKMSDLPVVAAVTGGTHQIDLGLGAFAPAEYLIEIGVGTTKELVPLKVGS